MVRENAQLSVENRPINLSLTAFRFPVAAVASILHRISGVGLLVSVIYFLYLLYRSTESAEGFVTVTAWLTQPIHQILVIGSLLLVIYHVVAGIRNLLLDFHIGTSLVASRVGAYLAFIVTVVLFVGLGGVLFL